MSRTDLGASYRLAARTTRREAGNFYIAFLSLPRAERRAVYALYAFFRELDDAADAVSDSRSPLTERRDEAALLRPMDTRGVRVSGMRTRLLAAAASARRDGHSLTEKPAAGSVGPLTEKRDESTFLSSGVSSTDSGRTGSAGSPSCDRDLALADAIERFSIGPGDIEDVIRGVEADLEPVAMETIDDLERYAYLVASAVGLATLAILNGGVPPTDEMRERAVRLGLGMQLVNVVRDVGEDAAQGRIYIPRDVLERHGASAADIRAGAMTPALRLALAEVGARARDHLRAGRELARHVPRHSRACLWLLSEVYGRILTRIEEAGYDVFPTRISLSAHEKLWLLATARCRI